MNKYKGFTTFLALILVALPAISFADGTYYYGNQGVNIIEAVPVKTVGTTIIPTNNTNTYTVGVTEPAKIITTENILGINIKSKAERDAEKAAQVEADRKAADAASVARNNDGTFAYGYTNGNGAQYTSGAKYLDARGNTNARYTASAGSAGNGFLPTTFGGWILAILLMSILVAIVRAFRSKFFAKKAHVQAHAH